jgi:uncharacterized protein with PIN domain
MEQNRYCPRCNKLLTKNSDYDETSLDDDRVGIENYKWECNDCDENFFDIETLDIQQMEKKIIEIK